MITQDKMEAFVKFFQCMKAGKHDFDANGQCKNCAAKNSDPTLTEVVQHAVAKTKGVQ